MQFLFKIEVLNLTRPMGPYPRILQKYAITIENNRVQKKIKKLHYLNYFHLIKSVRFSIFLFIFLFKKMSVCLWIKYSSSLLCQRLYQSQNIMYISVSKYNVRKIVLSLSNT